MPVYAILGNFRSLYSMLARFMPG